MESWVRGGGEGLLTPSNASTLATPMKGEKMAKDWVKRGGEVLLVADEKIDFCY